MEEQPTLTPTRAYARRALSWPAALCLMLGMLFSACASTSQSLSDAEQATQDENWPLAAKLWFNAHTAEDPKTPRPYLETARAMYELGDAENACSMLDMGLQRYPHNSQLLLAKGRMLEACGYKRAAEAMFARLVAVNNNTFEGLSSLGRLRMALGLERAATSPLERLVELGGADAQTHEQLGEIYKVRGLPLRALEHYARAIELGSEDPQVLLLAVQLAREPGLAGQFQEAQERSLAWLEQLSNLRPQYTRAHYLRGLALAEQDRKAEAVVALRRAVETDPGHLPSLIKLAEMHASAGEAEAAGKIIDRALALRPDEASRQTLLSLLERD